MSNKEMSAVISAAVMLLFLMLVGVGCVQIVTPNDTARLIATGGVVLLCLGAGAIMAGRWRK